MPTDWTDAPAGVWADWLEEQGQDTAVLRAWLEWGIACAGGRHGGYVQWMRTSHGTGGDVTERGNGYRQTEDREAEAVGDGFGNGGRYGEGCGYQVRTGYSGSQAYGETGGCGIGYVNGDGLARGSGYA